jgi:ABC-type uncharacterized transport system permease subunit
MMTLSYIAFVVSGIIAGLTLWMILKATLFIVLVSILYLNLKCIFYGLVFFARDARQISKFHQSLEDLVWNKPADVFPSLIQLLLTYALPYILVGCYIYNLLRGQDNLLFWGLIVVWLSITATGNYLVWKKGLQKYESIG